MADLFDQKSLRIPPMMGKAARTKLNKSGSYRMPPNLKGVHSAAQGGLGGAYTKGKKLRGFSGEDGSFVDPEGENGTPMTGLFGVGGQQIKPLEANFSSGLGDDEPKSNGIPDDSPEAAGAALNGKGPKSPKDMNPDDIPQQMDLGSKRIQEELSKYMPYARQQLESMQNPREGGLNLPMLQFAAGLMSPTRTGSFGESIGTGMNMGLNALANQRKQDLDYQTLKAKLGLDVEKTPLEVATKLADIENNNLWKQLNYDLRKEAQDAKGEYKPTSTEQKEIEAMSKSAPINARIAKQLEEAIPLVSKVGTGPVAGSWPIMAIKKAGFFPDVDPTDAAKLQNTIKNLQAMAAKYLNEGQGAVSNYERDLYKLATGDTDVPEEALVGLMQEMQTYFGTQARKSSEWQAFRKSNPKGSYTDFTAQFGASSAEDFPSGGDGASIEDISKLSQEDLEKEIEKERQKAQQ